MQIEKNKNSKKRYIVLGAIIALATGSFAVYYFFQHSKQENYINLESPTNEQIKAGSNSKNATVKGEPRDTGNLESDQDNTNTAAGKTPQILITAASQNNNIIQVRSIIQKVTTEGSCTLTLTKDQTIIRKSASVQALADSSTCKGFDISISEFPDKGTWLATVLYEDANGRSEASKNVVIN